MDAVIAGLLGGLKSQLKETGESITAGQVVSLLNDTDKVMKPSTGATLTDNGDVTFNSGVTSDVFACQLDTDKVLVCYNENNTLGRATVLTVSGVTVTAGAETTFESADSRSISVCALSTTKALVVYQDLGNSNYGTVCVLTISGTTVTAGTPVAINAKATTYCAVCKLDTDKALIAYRNATDTQGDMAVISVSETVPSVGSIVDFNPTSGDVTYCSLAQLDTNKAILCYKDVANSDYGTAQVITVSGTVPSTNAETVFESAATIYISVCALSTTKALVAYQDSGNSSYGTACVLSINGTTITAGTPVVFESASSQYISVSVSNNSAESGLGISSCLVGYTDAGNSSYATVCNIRVVGTTRTAGTPLALDAVSNSYFGCAKFSSGKVAVCRYNATNGVVTCANGATYPATGYTNVGQAADYDGLNKVPYIPF